MNTITCPDLAEAIAFFTEKLGFRLDMIMPADSPRRAVVSRDGLELRLEQINSEKPPEFTSNPTRPVICRENDSEWIVGRAGMEYRDLIPDRLGGRVIASHIRLTRGGEVPDYVHYHKIGFQMIFCKAGRIRVVYQDQGEPFWLEPGDGVLQPPEIRHRVLEAEAGSEVIEISSPAEHETWVDHEMILPTKEPRLGLEYAGQEFVRHVAEHAKTAMHPKSGSERTETGIGVATKGLINVWLDRFPGENAGRPLLLDVSDRGCFIFVLEGRLQIEPSNGRAQQLSINDSVLLLSDTAIRSLGDKVCRLLVIDFAVSK